MYHESKGGKSLMTKYIIGPTMYHEGKGGESLMTKYIIGPIMRAREVNL